MVLYPSRFTVEHGTWNLELVYRQLGTAAEALAASNKEAI